jgi:hypothetical protein
MNSNYVDPVNKVKLHGGAHWQRPWVGPAPGQLSAGAEILSGELARRRFRRRGSGFLYTAPNRVFPVAFERARGAASIYASARARGWPKLAGRRGLVEARIRRTRKWRGGEQIERHWARTASTRGRGLGVGASRP